MRTQPPLYAELKQMILRNIKEGAWKPGTKLPSENDLVQTVGASRMTVNRALRELSLEGAIIRMQGVGSFVADMKPVGDLLEVQNIADEITARRHVHNARVVLAAEETAPAQVAMALSLGEGARAFHSVLVHQENGIPVQLEDRFVNPVAAPHYLQNDFTRVTPYTALMRIAPLTETEHLVEAVLPAAWEARLLAMATTEPCLLLHRRTWCGPVAVSSARLLYPGMRYRLQGRRSK